MEDTVVCNSGSRHTENGLENSASISSTGFPFPRRIQFQPARQPFLGFTNSDGDFHIETLNPPPHPQQPVRDQACQNRKRIDTTEVFESGIAPEISFNIKFRKIGAGLENLGNTCFLNSVLQCLTYTEPLAAYLQSGKHQISCCVVGFCALCAIQRHVNRALQSTGRILAPKDLVSNLRCISRNFRIARQEDAHEYMVNLLESMHKCCLPLGTPSESPGAYEKSLVHKIFGGRLRSQVKCMECHYSSNKFDPFLDLSLEILKADTLYKALSHFTAPEELDDGERQYQCQHCKQKVRALKQLTVHKAPFVLTIHLKRFAAHNPSQKIDKKVQFGATLDLKPFVSAPFDENLNYTLYGVLVHAGWSTHSGHYYCFIRTSSAIWYSLDDNQVFQVSEKTVLEQKAYMLFYVCDTKNTQLSKKYLVVNNSNPPPQISHAKVDIIPSACRVLSSKVDILPSACRELSSKDTVKNEGCVKDTSSDGISNVDVAKSVIQVSSSDGILSDENLVSSIVTPLISNGQAISEKIPEKVEVNESDKAPVSLGSNEDGRKTMTTGIELPKGEHPGPVKCKKTKKSSKPRFLNMRFAAKMLLGPRKREHKLGKRRAQRRNFLSKLKKIDKSELTDVDPSTSDENTEVPHNLALRSMSKNMQEDSRTLGCSDPAVPSSLPEPLNVGQSVISGSNGYMWLLTRGIEDTLVGRWDDEDEPSVHVVESNHVGIRPIGHVLDEWDEEYDGGKRKKLRKSKGCFSGTNPFDEVASQKLRLKKIKIEGLGVAS